MQATIVPRAVRLVNHCFTTCTDRTSRVKPFTGRICSTVLDKDDVSRTFPAFSSSKELIVERLRIELKLVSL